MEIRAAPSAFAGEIIGADLFRPSSEDDRQAIAAGMDRYGALIARGQTLDNESQAAFARPTLPQFRYRHFSSVGDFVIRDNRTTLHRGLRFDPAHPRDLRRVTTRGVLQTQEAA